MAIYSLHHGAIGRSTHKSGTAGANIRYITRPEAASAVMAHAMPADRHQARYWLDRQEKADRKNARVCDKLMVALPRELHPLQRHKLVRDFLAKLTDNQVPWYAVIHELGKDANNPHAHIIIRDRHITTGKRHMQLSEKGSTERIRLEWEEAANAALAKAGQEARITRLSLKDQGITDREPSQHRGEVRKGWLRRQFNRATGLWKRRKKWKNTVTQDKQQPSKAPTPALQPSF
jgi:hypothetical protein